jgi:hypothetical protein
MGNFILNTYYKTSRKEEWDALRLIDRVFYTPNSLSPPSPDISWILKRRPFAGWELTLDSVPPDSIYFLQGTGVSLKRLGGTSSIIYDPFRSAIIKPKWGTAKQELLLNVVGRDCQKRTFKVDLNQAEIDWPWCATRLVLPLFLIGVVIRVGWLFYRKRKRRLSHKTK